MSEVQEREIEDAVGWGRWLYGDLLYKAPEQLEQMGVKRDDDLLTIAIRAAVMRYAESSDRRGEDA